MQKLIISFLVCIAITSFIPGTCFALSGGDKLIPFKARALSGETVNLEKIMKKQPVMLFFWASW